MSIKLNSYVNVEVSENAVESIIELNNMFDLTINDEYITKHKIRGYVFLDDNAVYRSVAVVSIRQLAGIIGFVGEYDLLLGYIRRKGFDCKRYSTAGDVKRGVKICRWPDGFYIKN